MGSVEANFVDWLPAIEALDDKVESIINTVAHTHAECPKCTHEALPSGRQFASSLAWSYGRTSGSREVVSEFGARIMHQLRLRLNLCKGNGVVEVPSRG